MAEPSSTTAFTALLTKFMGVPIFGGLVYYFFKPRTLKEFVLAVAGSAVLLVTLGPVAIQSVYHYLPFLMNLGAPAEVGIQCLVGVVGFALFEAVGKVIKDISKNPVGFITSLFGGKK
jgi:hypothetical protein